LTSAPGLWQRCWGSPAATRLGYRGRASAPKTSRTQHPCGLRRPRSAERGGCAGGQCPGRSRYSCVPGSVAIRRCVGLALQRECPVRPGSRSGRVVRRLLVLGAAPRRGSGGLRDGASAPSPFTLGQLRADPVAIPRPNPAARPVAAPRIGRKTDTAGVPSKRPAAGAWPRTPASDSAVPVTTGCHRSGWPRRLPLGVGSPAVPWPQCLTKRLTSNTSFVWSMW
jgi:hypothetical protein